MPSRNDYGVVNVPSANIIDVNDKDPWNNREFVIVKTPKVKVGDEYEKEDVIKTSVYGIYLFDIDECFLKDSGNLDPYWAVQTASNKVAVQKPIAPYDILFCDSPKISTSKQENEEFIIAKNKLLPNPATWTTAFELQFPKSETLDYKLIDKHNCEGELELDFVEINDGSSLAVFWRIAIVPEEKRMVNRKKDATRNKAKNKYANRKKAGV